MARTAKKTQDTKASTPTTKYALKNNPAQPLLDIQKYFDTVDPKNGGDGLVWVKSIMKVEGGGKGQVAVFLKNTQGERIHLPFIEPGDPICLSEYADLEDLRKGTNLRSCVSRRLLRFLTTQEAMKLVDDKAKFLGISTDELVEKARRRAQDVLNRKELDESEVDRDAALHAPSEPEDIVNPYIRDLMAKVSVQLKDSQRVPASSIMEELLDMADQLSMDDFICIQAEGYWPTVKKWAGAKLAEMHGDSDDLENPEEGEE